MAQLESQATAGYFPTPPPLLASLASLLCFQPTFSSERSFVLLDPVAGDGAAIDDLRARWFKGDVWAFTKIVANEIEGTRFWALTSRLKKYHDRVIHADAFQLTWSTEDTGAAVLMLNPPYDTDPEHGRLEQRFLSRFTSALGHGGALLFILPTTALPASAEFLETHYGDLECWRFPEEHGQFKQCVVRGRRTGTAFPAAGDVVRSWAERPQDLPILGNGQPVVPLEVEAGEWCLDAAAAAFDFVACRNMFLPGLDMKMGLELELSDLIGRQFPTALPPRGPHIALALSAGHFNGYELEADDERFPPILLKGVYQRELTEVSKKHDKDGYVVATVEVQTPKLRLYALRLDTCEFIEPKAGTEPTGATCLEDATIADILVAYNGALTRLMAQQFPPLHDPRRPEMRLPLPDVAALNPRAPAGWAPRQPFRIQVDVVNVSLKLWARGRTPMYIAEVGTGKTTMSVLSALALHPDRLDVTNAALAEQGFPPLPAVRRILVSCPPHLVGEEGTGHGWIGQIEVIHPGATVQVVRGPHDLHAEADWFILSRERGKLGNKIRGVTGHCPRCGAPIPRSASANARGRLTCQAPTGRPWNVWADLAEEFAAAVLPVMPESAVARLLTQRRRILRMRSKRPASRVLNRSAVERVCQQVYLEVLAALGDKDAGWDDWSGPLVVLRKLSRALGAELVVAGRLEAEVKLAKEMDGYQDLGPWQQATNAARALRYHAEAREQATDDECIEPHLAAALKKLLEMGDWRERPTYELSRRRRRGEGVRCGERLWQSTPHPRRVPLARYIARRLRNRFDLVILDEIHEASNKGTAQSKAALRLAGLPGLKVVLTGTVMSGYARSLFQLWWALDRCFREDFARHEDGLFARRYGFLKVEVAAGSEEAKKKARSFGAVTDREIGVRVIGDAPGILPLFMLRYLLPVAAIAHKRDLDRELPALREHQVEITADTDSDLELLGAYQALQSALMTQIRADCFTPLNGKLWGAMNQLPSYLERCHQLFEIKYPESVEMENPLVAVGRLFPAEYVTPKERWLLELIDRESAAGRRVLVAITNTGSAPLPHRIRGLIRARGVSCEWLNASRVPTRSRERWIQTNIVDAGVQVMLVNPEAVKTGLNNLVWFSVAVWYQMTLDARTYRQFGGRLHRIGQANEVDIYAPFYSGTTQGIYLRLTAAKVTAGEQVDGLTVRGALESAGASADGPSQDSLDAVLAMGQAVYLRLAG